MISNTTQNLTEALKNCENEQIQFAGAIQPLGVLIAYDREGIIRYASRNFHLFFGNGDLVGKNIETIFGADVKKQIDGVSGLGDWRQGAVIRINPKESSKEGIAVFVSKAQDFTVVEIETGVEGGDEMFAQLFVPVRDALWQLDGENNLKKYTKKVVEQVRKLSGYDRVMMYRFDSNWDGEVIAESKDESVLSYLGNHFPASDIPSQARALYTKNLVRLISDVDATPIDVVGGAALDMTYTAYRYLSPIHLEYLRNMGVRATLTISILQNGKLWGLIACHHTKPKVVPLRVRELFEFIGKTVSMKLSNIENSEKSRLYDEAKEICENISLFIKKSADIQKALSLQEDRLLSLFRSDSAVIKFNGHRYSVGDSLEPQFLSRCEQLCMQNSGSEPFFTDNLLSLLGGGFDADSAPCGALGIRIGEKGDYLMFFRAGIIKSVTWAGEPNKIVITENGIPKISPRLSFESWIETFRGRSVVWDRLEIESVYLFAKELLETLSYQNLKMEIENYRFLTEYSADMIARFDTGGYYTFVSPSAETIFGLPPSKMVGRHIDSFILPEDRLTMLEVRASLFEDDHPRSVVFRTKRKSGDIVWVEYTIKKVEEDGKAIYIVNGRDITQKHTYQLAMEELHKRNSLILEASGDGIVTFDRKGEVIYANEQAALLLGWNAKDMIGHSCFSLLSPRDKNKTPYEKGECPLLVSLTKCQSIQSDSDFFERSDRSLIPVNYTCTPMTQDGQQTAVLVFRPRSDEARDDAALASTAIMESASEAVMVTDKKGVILSVNPAFSKISGYASEEVVGKTPNVISSGVHTQNFYREIWATILEGRSWKGEIWNRRKNGEIYPQLGSIAPILDGDGKIKNFVGVFSDISKAKQAEERLHYLANYDSLTGLLNKARFVESLNEKISKLKNSNNMTLGVIFIDLDRFKLINDTLGHSAGDSCLKEVALRLKSACEPSDILCRWGGDEFVVCVELGGESEGVNKKAISIIESVKEPLNIDGHELAMSLSAGISLYPQDSLNATDLIKYADTAMFRVKEKGRDGYDFYAQRLSDEAKKKFEIVVELRRAIKNSELVLHYQPQVGMDGKIVGFEALVRWQHPVRGLLSPYHFIPLAEELGLINDVGHWVLREACRQIAEWDKEGIYAPRVAVNIAPSGLKEELISHLEALFDEFSLLSSRVEIEITEGALQGGERVLALLERLNGMGISISVDDFGTGYSSLSHLKKLPISCFKIDKSFIDDIPVDTKNAAIVRALLALGDGLGLEVVTEGVETKQQRDWLFSAGEVVVQGFYYSKPVAPNEAAGLLKKGGKIEPKEE